MATVKEQMGLAGLGPIPDTYSGSTEDSGYMGHSRCCHILSCFKRNHEKKGFYINVTDFQMLLINL